MASMDRVPRRFQDIQQHVLGDEIHGCSENTVMAHSKHRRPAETLITVIFLHLQC